VVPAVTAGELAVIAVGPFTNTLTAGITTLGLVGVPALSWTKFTVELVTNPVPVMTTLVPPDVDPLLGPIELTMGATREYVKMLLLDAALVPAGVVTVT
jgi:hypothetical protein